MRVPQRGFGTYICEGAGCTSAQSKQQHSGEGRREDQQEGNQQKPHHIHHLSTHIFSYRSENIFLKATHDMYRLVHLREYLNNTS